MLLYFCSFSVVTRQFYTACTVHTVYPGHSAAAWLDLLALPLWTPLIQPPSSAALLADEGDPWS